MAFGVIRVGQDPRLSGGNESAHKILKESGSIMVATLQKCDGVFLNLVNKPVFPGDSAAPRSLKRTPT